MKECYDAEHTVSLNDAVEDLTEVCKRNGGPVADDDIVALLWQVNDSISTVAEIVNKLKYKELTDQYSFHTEKALKYLKGV